MVNIIKVEYRGSFFFNFSDYWVVFVSYYIIVVGYERDEVGLWDVVVDEYLLNMFKDVCRSVDVVDGYGKEIGLWFVCKIFYKYG